jgi:hypothetical protein
MQPAPPKINAVEIVAAQPTEADSAAIARINAESDRSLPQVAYVVKVQLKAKPPVTSMAWALYVDDVLIPKYWEYNDGIYFTVLDPQFFADLKGKRLRFSQNGVDFYDTGVRLGTPAAPGDVARTADKEAKGTGRKRKTTKAKSKELPSQADVLK